MVGFSMQFGWNTTDEDEINVRKKRAKKESFEIVNLHKRVKVFSSFEVQSKSSTYLVELRSLEENVNSCSCPDSATNRLGTCKHIEAVKLQFEERSVKNRNTEIFLDTRKNKIVIMYPKGSRRDSFVRQTLDPFFSESGELLSEPTIAFYALKREIEKLDRQYQKKIRVSKLIAPWLQLRKNEINKAVHKERFFVDYKEGKRSFDFLKYPLFEYQKEGVLHLAFNERALLADEMGLGKTIQAIGASLFLQRLRGVKSVLVVTPTSLKGEWEEQIEKFTDLTVQFIVGNREKRAKAYGQEAFFYLANYEQILYDFEAINTVLKPDIVILDEAQRIKNWQTKTANSIKKLQSRYAFVLTGTPLENRIDEIYSIVQFLNPHIFGPLFRFNREFYNLNERGKAIGYKNIHLLHERLKPIMLRRRKEDVEGELPPKVVKNYFVEMDKEALRMYEEYELVVSRLASKAQRYSLSVDEMKRLQSALACMRMLCDSAYILNPKITISPKIDEIVPIIEELLSENRKIIVFSEWVKMLDLLAQRLESEKIDIAWHTGELNQLQRREEIKRFKESDSCKLFLSSDSGSVGLNLQVANVVINLDIPWNPAKLEQRIARAWRKHQTSQVQVINLITQDKLEHRILHLVEEKQHLSDTVLDGLGEDELSLPSGRKELLKDLNSLVGEAKTAVKKVYNPQHFVEDSVAMFSDRIKSIQEEKETFFIVVDRKDEGLTSKLMGVANEHVSGKRIEIVDKEEFALIQRLIDAGLLKKTESLALLYEDVKEKSKIDFQKAKVIFENAKRKYEMAKLLFDGGFQKESLEPLKEGVEESLRFLAHLQAHMEAKVSLHYIKQCLVHTYGLDEDEMVALVEKVRRGDFEDSEQLLTLSETVFQTATSQFDKQFLK
jgi:SNF2 family DNA or RNA helicase